MGLPPDMVKPVVSDLLGIFIHGLLTGFVHADLHPGNIILDAQRLRLCLVDWGLVLTVPEEHRELVRQVLLHIHGVGADPSGRWLNEAFARLGVTKRPSSHSARSDIGYSSLAKFFDIAAGACGELNIANIVESTECFELPAWVKLWQKAT